MSTNRNLCKHGAMFIRNYESVIVSLYNEYAKQIATHIGEMGFFVFLIEPEFYQYYDSQNENRLSGKEMAS